MVRTSTSKEVISPTTITASRRPTPATAMIASRRLCGAPVKPPMAIVATRAMTSPAVAISGPVSEKFDQSGVR